MLWYQKQEVTVITEPDPEGRVCIKLSDGRIKIADSGNLELPPHARFDCWWQGKDRATFVIRKMDIQGQEAEMMTIPRSLLPELMAIMKENKTSRDSALYARQHPTDLADKVDKIVALRKS